MQKLYPGKNRVTPLSIIAIFLISLSLSAQDKIETLDQIISVVGSNIILESDIENQFVQLLQQGVTSQQDMKCKILEELMYQKLLVDQAEIDSIEITLKEVEDVINRRLTMFINQIGSEEKLVEYFGKSLLEMRMDFREPIKEQLLAERMQAKITGDVKVTPSEIKSFFKKIPQDSLPLVNAEIEFEQIVKYPEIKESDKLAVKERLREFRERILNGEKFATLAVLYSEDKGSAKNGGELGMASRSDFVPEFSAAAFSLKPGEVSNVVETEFGYHIIQLIERKGELINVRHILLNAAVTYEAIVEAKSLLDSVRGIVVKDSVSFGDAADKYSDDENSKNNNGLAVNPYTGSSRFEVDALDPTTYNILRAMEIGQISKVFETVDDQGKKVYKVVRLRFKSKAHKANLKDDYQRITEYTLERKKQDLINEWIIKKQKNTYVRIDKDYANCTFNMDGWGKK